MSVLSIIYKIHFSLKVFHLFIKDWYIAITTTLTFAVFCYLLNRSQFFFQGPDIVKNLTIVNVNTTSVSLNWLPPEGFASSYMIEILENSTLNTSVNSTSVTVENLIPGKYYTFLVSSLVGENTVKGESRNISAYTSKYLQYYSRKYFSVHIQYSFILYFRNYGWIEFKEDVNAMIALQTLLIPFSSKASTEIYHSTFH